uniref:Uncharacterized protein LOC109506005 n=2 Tax=Elaeis guineensis var. tenera TaxID=51953 RepID=A0A6J0PJQ4_ELAGV|nr:uncharacterized protein LOC109506005 [Elaeis guineensis]
MIQNDKTGVRYSHPANRMIRVFSSLSRQELLDHLYSCIPVDKEKYEIKLKWKSPNLSGRLMQSNYILVPIDDDEDVEEMLTFPLKYSECRFLELYIEKKNVPSFGYDSRHSTQTDNNVGLSSSFVTLMVQTNSVDAVFAEQHSTTVGSSCSIIQSPMVTSPISSATVTSPLLEVVVSAGDDTHIGNDDWVVGGINSDNLDFESDESEDEDYWMDEDSSTNDDDGEDENDDEDVQANINVGETK